ncbi:hypothetical protein CDL15_Pgr004958 [Punica granatum]|uniref:Uncharacterized protein n=1 Tax=Punica granatum TaxID=22663 RepID=A0A218WVV2_PUNGR|nr:hypothetical protein CDL15_Pgr004958 [Punica granatum]PKI77239.1 hypothetical protein CRG98_002360 [Punica granatum]
MRTRTLYLRDLSLLLFVVFYCQSSILILDQFLHYNASVLISLLSITSICHYVFLHLKLGKIFDSQYWSAYPLVLAYLVTADDSTNWNSSRAWLVIIVGLLFLAVYGMTVAILSYLRPSEQREGNQETASTPLLVEISFVFIGNGLAIIGRGLIPGESLGWAIVGAAIMLFIALLFFFCFVHCSIKD